ncbi:CPBP family intramembrane glutamic endopeptidase [Streptomyces antibioticus]|uniref:CPBP family glutamic-type intramembrane protease n=1 Tax=Streptomyces TaxID=1883 RepID=UPI001587B04C|nr:CPBP family intramembrane glutamic endopeptidase [Streptomyces sp. CAI-85]MBO7936707.1 CPBP family intramembrane metalloprotease [Streptomyces sp. S9]NUV61117.1 CPBP family intramembrane metalloprotease [Streptomyces sp. CAI-85]
MNALEYAGLCTAVVGGWLALYRLPFGDPARRRRLGLWLDDRTGLRPGVAFALFGTALYLVLGAGAAAVLWSSAGLSLERLVGHPPGVALLALLLAVCGTSSLNILCVSLLYRVNPRVDVPGEIARVQWISSILVLPRHCRWAVPAAAALVEELVFRGTVLLGLGAVGSGFLFAAVFNSVLFAVGQVVLVSNWVQAYVLGTASLALGAVGSLLTAGTGSVLPALVLHMSFAGFYTNLSTAADARASSAPRRVSP